MQKFISVFTWENRNWTLIARLAVFHQHHPSTLPLEFIFSMHFLLVFRQVDQQSHGS